MPGATRPERTLTPEPEYAAMALQSKRTTTHMTAQRLLKIFALISIGATAAAIFQWRQTGLPPSPVTLQISAGAFIAALVAGLAGQETRPRIMLRFLAAVCALVATVAFVSDMSRAGEGFTPASGHLSQLAPSVLAAARSGITRVFGPFAWDPAATALLGLPTFLLFAILAALFGYASRRRQELSVFVN